MTEHRNADSSPTPSEREFVERLRKDFAPEPSDTFSASTFDARLAERIEQRKTRGVMVPVLAAAAAAAALYLAAGGDPEPESVAVAARDGAVQTATTIARVETGTSSRDDLVDTTVTDPFSFEWDTPDGYDDALPDDYLAISDVFFSG